MELDRVCHHWWHRGFRRTGFTLHGMAASSRPPLPWQCSQLELRAPGSVSSRWRERRRGGPSCGWGRGLARPFLSQAQSCAGVAYLTASGSGRQSPFCSSLQAPPPHHTGPHRPPHRSKSWCSLGLPAAQQEPPSRVRLQLWSNRGLLGGSSLLIVSEARTSPPELGSSHRPFPENPPPPPWGAGLLWGSEVL